MITNAKIVRTNVQNADYITQTAKRGDAGYIMSRSELCRFAECPAEWILPRRTEPNHQMDWGAAIDCLATTPEQFPSRFAVCPETYQDEKGKDKPWNWNATACKDWRRKNEGRVCIKAEMFTEMQIALHALNSVVGDIIAESDPQTLISAVWKDDESEREVPLQGLVDLAPRPATEYGRSLFDLKTSESIDLRGYARSIYNYNYDMQAALYLDIWNSATIHQREEFCHIVQKSSYPYTVGKRILSAEFIEVGRRKYQAALRLYCECLNSKHWPSYEECARSGDIVVNGWHVTGPEAWMVTQ